MNGTVLVCGDSPLLVQLRDALLELSFAVAQVSPTLLEARVISEAPEAVVVDAASSGIADAVDKLFDLPTSLSAEIVLVGAVPPSLSQASERAAAVVSADVSPHRLAEIVTAVIERRKPRETLAPGAAHETNHPHLDSELPPISDFPRLGEPELSVPEGDHDGPLAAPLAPLGLSDEIQALLSDAEERVSASLELAPSLDSDPQRPRRFVEDRDVDGIAANGNNGHAAVPHELLLLLDEPLDPDDDGALGPDSSASAPQTRHGPTGRYETSSRKTDQFDTAALRGPAETSSGVDAESSEHVGLPEAHAPHMHGQLTPPPTHTGDTSAGGRVDVQTSSGFEGGPPSATSTTGVALDAQGDPYAESRGPTTTYEGESPHASAHAPATRGGASPGSGRRPSAPPPTHATSGPRGGPSSSGELPEVFGPDEEPRIVALAIATRATGALSFSTPDGVRALVLQEGDFVTATSTHPDETLLAFLVGRGDLERRVLSQLDGKLPPAGRHAGAALVAHGQLGQDDLWPVLRAHAEWILGRVLTAGSGRLHVADPSGRLRAEPNVFGGATGAEVFVETLRRVLPSEVALERLGGPAARVGPGQRQNLLAECALEPEAADRIRNVRGDRVDTFEGAFEEWATTLYAVRELGILESFASVGPETQGRESGFDPLDEEAIRARVRARSALVEEGDYFQILGVPRSATNYEIRRAYLALRRELEPSHLLTASTADLADELRTVVEVLDEAFEILRDTRRKERYRRAIETGPPR